MRRSLTFALLLAVAPAVPAASVYVSPDVPTTVDASTYLPSEVIRNDGGVHSPVLSLPPAAAIDALFRRDDGRWLFSFDAPVQLSTLLFDPSDVALFDGTTWSLFFDGSTMGVPIGANLDAVFLEGGGAGNIVVSFDVPVVIRGIAFLPADLVRFTGPIPDHFLDSTTTTPPIPFTTNVTGADVRGGLVVLAFDVATTLGADTHLPGELVSWSGVAFASYLKDPAWPAGSRVDGLSFLADPGRVSGLQVAHSTLSPGDLTLSWSHSCSAGAEDYAIYEGDLASPYSHVRIDCTDDGADFIEEVKPSAGDRYYLVVPWNANDEGSYGDSTSGARPPGAATCVPTQVLSLCP